MWFRCLSISVNEKDKNNVNLAFLHLSSHHDSCFALRPGIVILNPACLDWNMH